MPTPDAPASAPLPSPTWCYRCGYNLGGLSPAGVCPECGLDAAASWPVWDLRHCHEVYVRHVLAELQWIGLTAALVGPSVLAVAAVLGLIPISDHWHGASDVMILIVVLGFLAMLAACGPLGAFERRLRKHPEAGRRCTAAPRLLARVGWGAVAAGVGLFALPGGFLADAAPRTAGVLGLLGALAITIGVGLVTLAAFRYARVALERLGRPVPPRWLDFVWVLLPLAGLVVAVPAAFDVWSGWYAAAAVALGGVCTMLALARRCLRGTTAPGPR